MPDFATAVNRRLLQALPTVAGILVLNFLLLQQVPGDAVDILAGEAGGASAESMAALRQAYGMDGSLAERLLAYVGNVLQGNLGVSPRFNAPVLTLILERLPNSLFLVVSGLTLAVLSGVTLGVLMAEYAGRLPDRLLSLLNLLLYSTPGFWIGLLLILLFSVQLGWLPANGHATIGVELEGLAWLMDRARHAVLPIVTVATFFIAVYARLTRAAMLEVRNQEFIRTARAKGVHPLRITLRHTLRNALIPVSTMAGVHFAALFGGAAVTETVFGWPGLGRLTLDAVMTRDFNLLLGILLLSSFVVVVVNILVDLLQQWLDPRTRTLT
ncbi:ABC transporter permease [Yanghanlia caeni]|uniref:ABC transporter permease n=1 Tax=Yanghanlia caeni TaxID=3064283 RepID=A0ABU1D7G7_9BURK|nr:ABC transporter permease [Alcaligenaceae bacterium LG-2]HZH56058.1 ABC transporter permease [Burkholderiaceae bacterium]